MKRLLALAVLLVTAACSHPAPHPQPQPSAARVVFQIHTAGGFIPRMDRDANIPELTVFDDGRAIFLEDDPDRTRHVLEGRLPEAKLKALMAQAEEVLAGLDAHYVGIGATDLPDTRFAVVTKTNDVRSTSVYGFSPDPNDYEQNRPVLDRLRRLRLAFFDAAAAGAVPYAPDSVTLLAEQVEATPDPSAVRDWPKGLPMPPGGPALEPHIPGQLIITGDTARELVRQVPYRPHFLYRAGGKLYHVAIKPEIPLLR